MALGCGLTSVRGNRGKNNEMNRWFPKNIQRKKTIDTQYSHFCLTLGLVFNPVNCPYIGKFFFH
jgi:hypothetical protein